MDMTGMVTALAAGLVGALLGGAVAWRVLGARSSARYTRLVAAAREQLAASTQNLRATNARLQAELEKEKAGARQRQLALAAEQRASVTRLEGQLRFAYAEIDRLNGSAGNPGQGHAGDTGTDAHGFALTRPYER